MNLKPRKAAHRAVKLEVVGHIPLACLGDAFRWDRKGIRTLAKYSRYLDIEGLFDWPKTARRELRSGFIVGAHTSQGVSEDAWSDEVLRKFALSGSDLGTFYDFKQLGMALISDLDEPEDTHLQKKSFNEVFVQPGIWGLDFPTTYDAGVPPWIRIQSVPATDTNGARLDRIEVRSKGSWSGVHVNEGGTVTAIEQTHGRQVLFYSEMDIPDSKAVKWLKRSLHQYKYANIGPWRHTVLEPGSFVIIPPAKPHAIYSLEKSVTSVQFWYQVDTLPLTEISIKLDAPLSPHQTKLDPQLALTSIAQAQFDDSYKNIETVELQALCRLMRGQNVDEDDNEDFEDVVVLEDSDADEAEEPEFLPEMLPDPAAVAREPVDKKGLQKQLETDMKGRIQPAQAPPSKSESTLDFAVTKPRSPKRRPKTPVSSSPLVLKYPIDDPYPVCLHQRDLDLLRAAKPLTPALVEFGIKHWIHNLALTDLGLAMQVFIFSPLFYTRLSSPDQGYPSVEDWGDAADLAASPFVVVPIRKGDHYYHAIIHQPHASGQPPPTPARTSLDDHDDSDVPTTVYTFDPLGFSHPETVSLIRKYLVLKYRAPRNPAVKIDTSSSARASRSSSKRKQDLSVRAGERVIGKTVEVAHGTEAESGIWMLWNLREAMEVLESDPALLATLKSAASDPDGAPDVQRSNLLNLIQRLGGIEMEETYDESAKMRIKLEEESET